MLVGICTAPSIASASTPYVSANVGVGFAGNSNATTNGVTTNDVLTFKRGMPFSGAFGLKSDEFRIELALGCQKYDLDQYKADLVHLTAAPSGNEVEYYSSMINAYYDYAIANSNIKPYVMGGVGAVYIDSDGPDLQAYNQTKFAWQLGFGVGVKASKNIVVDLGYRYFKPTSYTVTDLTFDTTKFSASTSNILLGLRYDF